MSYEMNAEGLNGVNIQTSIIAGHDWIPNIEEGAGSPVSTVLFVSGTAPDTATPFDTDATTCRGNLQGNGVTGWGGNLRGSGIVGIAGSAMPPPPSAPATIRDKNVGVYGCGGDAGVLGDGSADIGQAGAGNADGVRGFGSGTFSGVAGFGDPANTGIGVFGSGRGPKSPGVRGQAGTDNANGIEGFGSGNFAGVAGFGDGTHSANSGIGVFAVGGAPQPGSGRFGGPGVYAVGNGVPYVQINQPLGVYGIGGGGNAPGIFGIGSGGPAFAPVSQAAGVYGIGGAGNAAGVVGQGGAVGDGVQGFSGSGTGVSGESGSGVGVRASSGSATGLVAEGTIGLIASTSTPAGTAGQFDGNVVVNGDFTVFGRVKSVAVPFPDGSHRRLYCLESPENWFEDFGFGELSHSEARIQLDPGFSSVVDGEAYHVFITEYGDNNALYVADRSGRSFLVRAKTPDVSGAFSYRVVAKRKDIAAPRFAKVKLPPQRLQGN